MKKIFATMLCVSLATSMTACGKGDSSETESSAPAIKVYNEQLTTVTTTAEITEPASESEHAPLVPVIEQNVSDEIDLSLVAVNGYEIDLDNLTYQSFLQMTQLHKQPAGATVLDTSLFYFNSGMYCLNDGGTQLSVELTDKDGKLVENSDEEGYEPQDLYVKGLHCSSFWMKEDYSVSFYAGIKIGMDKDLFLAVMGTGKQVSDNLVYRNNSYTMIVEFGSETTETGDFVQVVDEITLLRN